MSASASTPKVPVIVAAVVRPVNRRLARMEDLLLEMRAEQDVQLKRAKVLQEQIDGLGELVRMNQTHIDRLAKLNKGIGPAALCSAFRPVLATASVKRKLGRKV